MSAWRISALFLALAAVGAFGACNSSSGGPNDSRNEISFTGSTPAEACIDGDGTTDSEGHVVFTNVPMTFNFQSRIVGSADTSAFNDVILSSVDIAFDPAGVGQPSSVTKAFNATIPVKGTGSGSVSVLTAADVSNYFNLLSENPPLQGQIRLTFHGRDASGNAVTVSVPDSVNKVNYAVASTCSSTLAARTTKK